jgi:deazaflavin-dependent oxidoreductase (nitroreductase family)
MRRLLAVLGIVVLAIAGGFLFILVAMRSKSPRMLRAVRQFNREVTNKVQIKIAGTQGSYASVIRHRGRKTGKEYETPIVPFPVDDAFLISLPYGPDTDWCKNVLVAGEATLVTEGETYAVTQPEVVATADVQHLFPANEQRTHRMFRVEHCLKVQRV